VIAAKTRPRLHLVITGHVDHGKSTIIGRLLSETGCLPQGKLERIRAYCERNAKPFEYAFLLDALKDEQAQGITIESSRVHFMTAKRDYVIIDAPGHIEFLRNMVTGASQASAALLVIDAKEGMRENSRRHGYILSLLGIRRPAVLINKMDLIGYDEGEFRRVAKDCNSFLKRVGVHPDHVIPVCGLHGDNLAQTSTRMRWYRGPTVLSALDGFAPEASAADQPFRMPVQDVYKFTAEGDTRRIIVGTVESGSLSAGDEVVFSPSGKSSGVRALEDFPRPRRGRVGPGAAAAFTLADQVYVKRGELVSRRDEKSPRVGTRFEASLFWLGREPLKPAKDYVLKIGSARVAARLEKILQVVDASSLAARRGAKSVTCNEAADCLLRTSQAVAFDLTGENVAMGRFVLVDGFEISGGGVIRKALPDAVSWVREKVLRRNLKWQKSFIAQEMRAQRYRQKPALVLITGPRDSKRKEVAKALEAALFDAGRHVYYLGLGSALYGVAADIRDGDNHREDIRRFAEMAHIILDSGLILIVSAAELTQEDFSIIKTAIDEDRIETVWVGRKGVRQAVAAIQERLRARGFLTNRSQG